MPNGNEIKAEDLYEELTENLKQDIKANGVTKNGNKFTIEYTNGHIYEIQNGEIARIDNDEKKLEISYVMIYLFYFFIAGIFNCNNHILLEELSHKTVQILRSRSVISLTDILS